MNINNNTFYLKDTFATAATPGYHDTSVLKEQVKTFEGSASELNEAIKKCFDIDFDTIVTSGIYYFSYFKMKDSFDTPLETKGKQEFNQDKKGHSYLSYNQNGGYFENEDITIAELSLKNTKLRLMETKEGKRMVEGKDN